MVGSSAGEIEGLGSGARLAGWRARVAEVLRRDPVAGRDPRAAERFERLLVRLASWVGDRREVAEAHLRVHADGLTFLVLTRSTRQDEAFDEALSALDVELACDGEVRFRVDVLALPRRADPGTILRDPLVSVPIVPR